MMSDLRFALRTIRKRPGFASVAILTLALGLSANITIFSIVSYIFLRPLAVKNPERLAYISRKFEKMDLWTGSSWADYRELKANVAEFDDMLATKLTPAHVSVGNDVAERTWVETVSGNYFGMLGIQPQLGRFFLEGEVEKQGADPIVILSYGYWMRKLGGDPSAVGKHLLVNGNSLTIVGIAPEKFSSAQWAMSPSLFIPATMIPVLFQDESRVLTEHDWYAFKILGSLHPGVSREQASSAVSVVMNRLDQSYRKGQAPSKMAVQYESLSRPDPGVASLAPFLAIVFMSLVGMVLLIACANVSNLMFARAADRKRELGIRAALGATRWQLIRQILVESTVLAIAAAIVGYFLSTCTGPLLASFTPRGDMPIRTTASFDINILWYTIGLSLLVGVGTGIAPALRATSFDTWNVIRGADSTTGRLRHWFRSTLVVSQIAFCVIVLICAGLFVQSLHKLSGTDLGFRKTNMTIASIDLGLQGYPKRKGRQFIEQLSERLEKLPGVQAVSYGTSVPFGQTMQTGTAYAEGSSVPGAEDKNTKGGVITSVNYVGPGFLQTEGATLLEGREFTKQDKTDAPLVAIINQSLARKLWPGKSPLGKRLRLDNGDLVEVVGLVRDGKYVMLNEISRPYLLIPFAQNYRAPVTLFIHHTATLDTLVPSLRETVREMDQGLPLYGVNSLENFINDSALGFMPLRMGATISATQGLVALLLSLMGIYGIVAYAVSQRTREIGIRMALGARQTDIFSLVVGGSMRLALVGMIIGLSFAFLAGKVLSGLLYNMNPANLPVFLGIPLLLVSAIFLACYLPARRATRVDPIVALRTE